jgi:PAS domain S-box-containing protein
MDLLSGGRNMQEYMKALLIANKCLYATLSSVTNGVLVIDEDKRIVFINRAATRLTGWSEREAIGQPLDSVFKLVNYKTGERVHFPYEKGLRDCRAEDLKDWFVLVPKSGGEVFVCIGRSPLEGVEGKDPCRVITFQDVTGYVNMQEKLRIEHNNFRMQFQYAPVGMAIVDENRVIQKANDCFIDLCNYDNDSIIGKRLGEALGCIGSVTDSCGGDGECDECIIRESITQVAKTKIPFRDAEKRYYLTRNGSTVSRNLKFNLVPLSFDGDMYVQISVDDITEQRKAEEKMYRAVEATMAAYNAKSEFLANMSHEIRTPLNGIIGMVDLTLLSDLTEEQRDNLSTVKTCANSLLNIINDVLDFSKMEAGKLGIENVEFDFKSLIEEVVKVHYHRAREKGLELSCQLPMEIPDVLAGDPNRLQQVLHNLLSNAVKFTDKGSIRLKIDRIDSSKQFVKLRFSVADTGIGISPEEMDKIFESFSQIDGSLTKKHGGTGLGLVISRRLIEMMGGDLRVKSKKGKGSMFSFTLTFNVTKRAGAKKDSMKPKILETSKPGASILLVEDDEVNQKVIGRMLEKMGYQPDVVDSGRNALKRIEQKEYDLCLMDIQMPDLDGIQTAAMIRKDEQGTGRHMPIVAITAYALQGDRERFLAMGMDEYIAKPFRMADLSQLLERLLTGRGSPSFGPSRDNATVISKMDSYIQDYAMGIQPSMDEIRRSLGGLEYAVSMGDTQGIEARAHRIKTLAGTAGAEKIKILAFRMQLAARRENMIEVDKLYRELVDMMDKYSVDMNGTGDENENTDCGG